MCCNHLSLCLLGALMLQASAPGSAQNFVQDTVKAFADSDFVFQRSVSNAPFLPIAFLNATHYGESEVSDLGSEASLSFTQSSASAGGPLPFLLTSRDAAVFGAYLSTSRFSSQNTQREDFRVDTLGVPVAWLRQVNAQWQSAVFAMPLGHRSTQEGSGWSVQTMGGAFARYTQNERVWWAFGVFGDTGVDEGYVLPYVGASWVINAKWTLSAIMPWPSLLYAPDENWLFSLGASPSGAVWSRKPANNKVTVNLDAWDFGISAERRIYRNLWLSARTGVGGLRALRIDTDDLNIDEGSFDVGANGFFSLSLRLRPALAP
jgi:hypothetical protein